jgi:hypothetical protein
MLGKCLAQLDLAQFAGRGDIGHAIAFPHSFSSLRGAKRRSNPVFAPHSGLLRFARNDGFKQPQRSHVFNTNA